jgi:carboxylesterase
VSPPGRAPSERGGAGPVVVLLHGLRSTPDELITLNNALIGGGIATRNPRLPHYSFSQDAVEAAHPDHTEWLESVRQEVLALRSQYSHVVLAGISAGATLALGSALRHAGLVDAVVLLSTTLRLDGWNVPFYRWLFPLALYTPLGRLWAYKEQHPYGVKNERIRAWIAKELETRKISSAGAAIIETQYLREYDRLIRYVKRTLPGSSCPPGLAVHSREDDVASLSNLHFLISHWTGGTLSALVLQNSYHMVTLDNERQQVAAEVISFVRRITATAPRPAAGAPL